MNSSLSVIAPRVSQNELLRVQNHMLILKKRMVKGVHYGAPYPGSSKDTLLKPGAELIKQYFGLDVRYEVMQAIVERDFDRPERSFVLYEYRAVIYDIASGLRLGEAIGSANSGEEKYAYRIAKPKCPVCGQETVNKSKEGGYYCWKKIGGCGATFSDDDTRITSQPVGKVRNANPLDLVNTINKMAQKRAFVSVIILTVAAGAVFTPDDEATVDIYAMDDYSDAVEAEFSLVPEPDYDYKTDPDVGANHQKMPVEEAAPAQTWATPENIRFLLDKLRSDGISDAWLVEYMGKDNLMDAAIWSPRFETGKSAYKTISDAYAASLPKAQPKRAAPAPASPPVVPEPDWDSILNSASAPAPDNKTSALEAVIERHDLRAWVMERFDHPYEAFCELVSETGVHLDENADIAEVQRRLTEVWMNTIGNPIVPKSARYDMKKSKGGTLHFTTEHLPVIAYSRSEVDTKLSEIGFAPLFGDMTSGQVIQDLTSADKNGGKRFVISYKRVDLGDDLYRFDFTGVQIAECDHSDLAAEVGF
jgi:ribosomal protein L37AE/L43A